MANKDKVMIGNSGDWVKIQKDHGDIELSIGEDGETDGIIAMSDWETFQVIQKLAEVSGLYLDKTGAQGLIIRRPENPREADRRDELAAQFTAGQWDYQNVSPSCKNAINYIIQGEIERGEL